MNDEDPFMRDFGVSSEDLHAYLAALKNEMTSAAELASMADKQNTQQAFLETFRALGNFLFLIKEFRERNLGDLVDLARNDIDRVLKGAPALHIRPVKGARGRPEESFSIQVLKGFCAAYLELVRRTGQSLAAASEKASRDLNSKGWRIPGGMNGNVFITPGRLRDWRANCVGKNHPNKNIHQTYLLVLMCAEAHCLGAEETAERILNQADPSDFTGYIA